MYEYLAFLPLRVRISHEKSQLKVSTTWDLSRACGQTRSFTFVTIRDQLFVCDFASCGIMLKAYFFGKTIYLRQIIESFS